MSMALVLEGAKDFLRGEYGWEINRVTIEFESRPAPTAQQWHVALDDGGVSAGDGRTYMLQEEVSIVVGVWRQFGATPNDRLGNLVKRTNPYLAQMPSVDKLERQVIAAYHGSFDLVGDLNTRWSLPDDELGSAFESTLVYDGRGGLEKFSHGEVSDLTWLGRRLRFRGLRRQQNIGSIG